MFTTVAAALAAALIARIVTVTGGFTFGFWPAWAIILQDYALFLAIWSVIWGIPFAVAVFSAVYLNRRLQMVAALPVGIALGIIVLLGLRRFLSEDVWQIVGQFNPAPRIGHIRVLLLL